MELRTADLAPSKALLVRPGRLRLLVAVGDALPGARREEELTRLVAAKANGTYDPRTDRYDAVRRRGGNWVLVESNDLVMSDFSSFQAFADRPGDNGSEFTLSPAGATKLHALTSANAGRVLVAAVDGEVRTTGTIHRPLGDRGLIDGGTDGWTAGDVEGYDAFSGRPSRPCPKLGSGWRTGALCAGIGARA